MIPRPPACTGMRIFRAPHVFRPGARTSFEMVDGVWSFVTSDAVEDASLELAFTEATRAYYAGDYERALCVLETEARREGLPPRATVDLAYSRMETLLVMGRHHEGHAALAHRLMRPRASGDYLRRCWLWAAQRELGLVDEARAELDWLDSDDHAATPSDSPSIFIGMEFFAWFGELAIAERMLVRMLRARTMIAWRAPDVIDGNTRLGWVASQGPMGAAGAAWGEGLLARARAQAADLGPL